MTTISELIKEELDALVKRQAEKASERMWDAILATPTPIQPEGLSGLLRALEQEKGI